MDCIALQDAVNDLTRRCNALVVVSQGNQLECADPVEAKTDVMHGLKFAQCSRPGSAHPSLPTPPLTAPLCPAPEYAHPVSSVVKLETLLISVSEVVQHVDRLGCSETVA